MPGTQELTRRIKSVKSTRKITRAMQMISAAKMRKAQNATLASRTYADLAWQLIRSLGGTNTELPLLRQYPEAKKIGVVLITTNRGLVGSFNTNLLMELRRLEGDAPEATTELIVIGRKGKDSTARMHKQIIADFPKLDTTIPVDDVYPIARLLTDAYTTGQYKKIVIIYNQFVSTLAQKPTSKIILPFLLAQTESSGDSARVIYEPSPLEVAEHLLPRIIESQLYQAILESDASEHSARMVMMKNATEAAGDIIDDLTLTYNQLRQNKITTELSEITAGRIALEKS